MRQMVNSPVIGILLDMPPLGNNSYSKFPWYAIRKHYCDAITVAGAIPILLPYSNEILNNLTNLVNGILIPGSDFDINPKLYSSDYIHLTTKFNDEKTDFEYKLLNIIKENNIPFLGICYGMQLLNVFFGGSLYQHIPDEYISNICHQNKTSKQYPTHLINVKEKTLLAKITPSIPQLIVNSNHHQAVKHVGNGLIVSATSIDGIIEAIEAPEYDFMLGVEWHPEYLDSEFDIAIFKQFVTKAQFCK